MRIQKRRRIKFIQLFVIFLAGLGGFFIVKNLDDGTQPRTHAETGTELPSVTVDESSVLVRLQTIVAELRKQTQEQEHKFLTTPIVSTTVIERGTAAGNDHKIRSSTPSTISTKISVPSSAKPINLSTATSSSTLSPFVAPSSVISIAGAAQLVIENLLVNTFIDSAQQVFISIETQARNRGTIASVNTPFKIFMTDSAGSSILLGEQLIPALAPNASSSKKVSFQCPKSGSAEVCVTVPAQFGISGNSPSETRVCKSVLVPEVAPTPSSSPGGGGSTGGASSPGVAPNNPTCLCNQQ